MRTAKDGAHRPVPRWTLIGVAVITAGAIALFPIDRSVAGLVGAASLGVCLLVVAWMLWLDQRAARETRRIPRSW